MSMTILFAITIRANLLKKFFLILIITFPLMANSIVNQTKNSIQGRDSFYISFDNNQTIANNLNDLLSITLPNNSTLGINHLGTIVLPGGAYKLSDIKTIIPISPTYSLGTLLKENNYLYQIDGVNPAYQTTGTASAQWTDHNGLPIFDMSTPFSFCVSKTYTLTITIQGDNSGDIFITSQYGDPRQKQYDSITKAYVFEQPTKSCPKIAYIQPRLMSSNPIYNGPSHQWLPNKGFLVQSDTDYSQNYPTIGRNNYGPNTLIIENSSEVLTWHVINTGNIAVTLNGITASQARFTLMGPAYNPSGQTTSFTPTTIILEGKRASGEIMLRYGFHLKQWLLIKRSPLATLASQRISCTAQGNYRLANVTDLTNAKFPPFSGTSSGNYLQRAIGGGFLSEDGGTNYIRVWTNEGYIVEDDGKIQTASSPTQQNYAFCISP